MEDDQYATFMMMNLPTETIVEILSRLPIKTLVACKSVCKTWLNLISDPLFAKFYSGSVEILLRNNRDKRTLYLIDQHEGDRKIKLVTKFHLPGPTQVRGSYLDTLEIVNSCNGFLCLSQYLLRDPCLICNPITGEYIAIPQCEWQKISPSNSAVSGFGYCQKTNQYKVVRMTLRYLRENGKLVWDVELYVLGGGVAASSSSWKNIGLAPYSWFCPTSVVYLNGFIHWGIGEDRKGNYIILSFDCENDQFGIVPPPPRSRFGQVRHLGHVGVVGDCLCFTFKYANYDRVEIWVMKDYGVQESWTKVKECSISWLDSNVCFPLKHSNNEDLMVLYGYRSLMFCRHKVNGYENSDAQSYFEAIVHTPTLVSVKDAFSGDNLQVHTACSRFYNARMLLSTMRAFLKSKKHQLLSAFAKPPAMQMVLKVGTPFIFLVFVCVIMRLWRFSVK